MEVTAQAASQRARSGNAMHWNDTYSDHVHYPDDEIVLNPEPFGAGCAYRR